MKQIVDKLNKIARAINSNIRIPNKKLIISSLDAITLALGGTPNNSHLIVDKLDDIAKNISHGDGGFETRTIHLSVRNRDFAKVVYFGQTIFDSDMQDRATSSINPLYVYDNTTAYLELTTSLFHLYENRFAFIVASGTAEKTGGNLELIETDTYGYYQVIVPLGLNDPSLEIDLYGML